MIDADNILYGAVVCSGIAASPDGQDRELLWKLSKAHRRPIRLYSLTYSDKAEGVVDYDLILKKGKLQVQKKTSSRSQLLYEGFSLEDAASVVKGGAWQKCTSQRYINPQEIRENILKTLLEESSSEES